MSCEDNNSESAVDSREDTLLICVFVPSQVEHRKGGVGGVGGTNSGFLDEMNSFLHDHKFDFGQQWF